MTSQAEGADVVEVALASAYDYGNDVVGIPQRFARAGAKTPVKQERCAMGTAGIAELSSSGDGIGFTDSADAAITIEDLFTEIGGLGAQFPLVDAKL